MKITINEEACIGCGACHDICESVFDIGDNGLAFVKNDINIEDNKDDILDAIESCPTSAISDNKEE